MTPPAPAGVFAHAAPPPVALPRQSNGVSWPTQTWPTAALDPERQRKLDQLADAAFAEPDDGRYGVSLAFVVIKGGQLVAERYGPTAGADAPLISWSMAKSITHALVGVQVAAGQLDPSRPAAVPEWANSDDPRHAITVDQLLRMVPGLEFNEDYIDAGTSHCIEMLFGEGANDMAAYTASQQLIAAPGTVFNYSSGTTNIICRLLADQVGSGPKFEAWMRSELLDRIGMGSSTLTFDGHGTWVGSSFLHATARDFAKFGLLYLRDGVWDGQRILPAGWVDSARTLRATDGEDGNYGAHWWIWDDQHHVFAAKGYETQRILVDPGSDAVVVRLGKTPIENAPNVDAWLREVMACLR